MNYDLNILYVFDDKYAPFAGISIYSLLYNLKKDKKVRLFCAGMNISEQNVQKMEAMVKDFGQTLVWIDTTRAQKDISSCDTSDWNGSKATWLKVFVPWDLPDDVDKILYIDSDSLVLDDITSICPYMDEEFPVAGVFDSVIYYDLRTRGLEEYYNAGVLILNVKKWKEEGFRQRFLQHLSENVENYPDNEQALLNDFFNGEIYRLPMKYNTQGFHYLIGEKAYFNVYRRKQYYTRQEVATAKEKPTIYHFFRIFGKYPWETGNHHPARKEYEKWKNMTLWKNIPDLEKKSTFMFNVQYIMHLILPETIYMFAFKKIYKG